MTAPPSHTTTPDDRPPVSGGDAHLALLIREARRLFPELRDRGKRELLRMAREFATAAALDQRDRQARQASAEEFGHWLHSNYWPSVSRRPQPNMAAVGWRVTSS